MVGIPGTELDSHTEKLIRDYCLGGIILFARNIEDPVQLATLCSELQERAMKHHGIPLFLAVDQEGGRVARLREPFTQFPGNEAIGADAMAMEKAAEFAAVTAREMTLVGLNMDLAPVVDVRRGAPEKHLMGRTFSDDPNKVSELGQVVVRALQDNGVMAVAKHFPGLGKTALDPHHHLPTIHLEGDEMNGINLPPFRAAIAAAVSGVMTSHAIYPNLESSLPATLSRKILSGTLREELGFEGLIITDDLDMGAIKKHWGVAGGAVESFQAGADILLICEDQAGVEESLALLRTQIIRGEIPGSRLHASLRRIKKTKSRFLSREQRISLENVRAYFGI
jgi:beta-N-acetylhexosaminidase